MDELGGKLDDAALIKQLYGKNQEVLGRIFGEHAFNEQQLEDISEQKEIYYRHLYKDHMKLIDGLREFFEASHKQNIPMALATASYLPNVDLVLDTLSIRKYFSAIVSACDVTKSKPDPQTFLLAAERLHMQPADCIVFEDVPKGVETAANANMPAVVITTQHKPEEFKEYSNVLKVIHDYVALQPAEIISLAAVSHNSFQA